jgi:hypothetical protein
MTTTNGVAAVATIGALALALATPAAAKKPAVHTSDCAPIQLSALPGDGGLLGSAHASELFDGGLSHASCSSPRCSRTRARFQTSCATASSAIDMTIATVGSASVTPAPANATAKRRPIATIITITSRGDSRSRRSRGSRGGTLLSRSS